MATDDKCCTIVPYIKIHPGKQEAFKGLCHEFVELTRKEPKCLYYGFSFNDDIAFCREGYEDANGVLGHLNNVGPRFPELFNLGDLIRIEVHGPREELERLRGPLADMKPEYFTLEYGFLRG